MKLALKAAKNRPLVFSFDAFGTLFFPRKPVILQYNEIALKYGFARDQNEVEQAFPRVFKEMNSKFPNYGKYSKDIKTPEDWWRNLILKVFQLEQVSNGRVTKQFCDQLLEHFTTTKAYKLYDDVIDTLGYMKDENIRIIVSSNSDPRIKLALENLGLISYIDQVYTSYDLGEQKPHGAFFESISRLEGNNPLVIHIGDERAKDAEAASNAGWVGIYVNRDKSSQERDQILKIDEGKLLGNTINSLTELKPLIAYIQQVWEFHQK